MTCSLLPSRRLVRGLLCGLTCILTVACSASPSLLKPYRPDVRQGNYLDQALLETLKPGMTREQVRFLMGTPLVVDIFNPDRWDYIHRFEPGRGGPIIHRHVGLIFENDRLAHIHADGFEAPPR
jgi:outer membrane protein assembly factor BamE